MPLTRILLACLAACLAIALSAGPATARELGPYVALGDSFTAGPLIPNQTGQPTGCFRSDRNYPSLVNRAIGPSSFRDVSCSGARTDDMTSAQSVTGGSNPPQFDALSENAKLVTLGIGGNDVGFSEIAQECATRSAQNPNGSPCKDYYNRGGTDELRQRIRDAAPKVAAVVKGIDERSPDAKILVVGYPVILPDEGPGCYPVLPIARGDVAYLRDIEKRLNAMIAQQASRNGGGFVDTYQSSIGHDVCQLPTRKWVEGFVPTAPAFPVHPNARGMRNSADQVLRALRR